MIHIDTAFDSLYIDILLRLTEPPKSKEEQEKFLKGLLPLATEMHNNTRMWANRGYTPKELVCLTGGVRPENIGFFDEEL
ncbi:hypothetical protein IJG29_01250 [Candidatus Saccharibacteria bacterium]|nr:hypothetical protein [Candidatus Saccharibacteria bacterium]